LIVKQYKKNHKSLFAIWTWTKRWRYIKRARGLVIDILGVQILEYHIFPLIPQLLCNDSFIMFQFYLLILVWLNGIVNDMKKKN
jgi:hypothetical protein